MRESKSDKDTRVKKIVNRLRLDYPVLKPALDYSDALQCLVATILSAQCTDARVNMVTPALFRRYSSVEDFAEADQETLEEMIRSTGFFRSKAKSIKSCCNTIVRKHSGRVPDTMEELVALEGVGRKTANCVLGNAYGKPAVMVDTHVIRLTWRMGMTSHKDPDKIEIDIKSLFPEDMWMVVSNVLILHGRTVCKARKPGCSDCSVRDHCIRRDVK
ncbi:endonuclease III [bacterium]|nr:endonuclease III [candidate division CSSED10-310 bacterium]